jgi:hypothetical protein
LTLGLVSTDAAHGAATYLVQNRKDRYEAVVKVVDPKNLSASQMNKLVRELKALNHLWSCPVNPYVMVCYHSPPFWRSDWDYIHIEMVGLCFAQDYFLF